jgi:hypothetical protein
MMESASRRGAATNDFIRVSERRGHRRDAAACTAFIG